jgi:hypothetical protein
LNFVTIRQRACESTVSPLTFEIVNETAITNGSDSFKSVNLVIVGIEPKVIGVEERVVKRECVWELQSCFRLQFHQLHFILKATHESLTAKRVSQLGLACLLIFQYLLSSKNENRQIYGILPIYDETKSDCCYIYLVAVEPLTSC